jgi:hypothetical protein
VARAIRSTFKDGYPRTAAGGFERDRNGRPVKAFEPLIWDKPGAVVQVNDPKVADELIRIPASRSGGHFEEAAITQVSTRKGDPD